MHVITPSGTVHNFPAARHAVPEEGFMRLYSGPDKTEWVADIPRDWAVVPGAPKAAPQLKTEYFHEKQEQDQRERKTTWLFGLIPLLITKKGLDQ